MPGPLSRRQAVGLGAVVVGGWAVGQVLRRTAPIGRDGSVANSDTVSKIGLMYCQGQLR